jgi:hypothetical protein
MLRGKLNGYPIAIISFSRPEPLLFLPSSSSIVLTRLSGPRCRPTTSQKDLVVPAIEPGTSGSVARNSDHYTTDAVILSSSYALHPFVELWPLFNFFILYSLEIIPWTEISPPRVLCLHTAQHKQKEHTHTSMLIVGFELGTSAFEQSNTVLAVSHTSTVMGDTRLIQINYTSFLRANLNP